MSQSHHSLPPLEKQLEAFNQEGWEQEVLSQLPATTEQQAKTLKAFVRAREIKSVGALLRGLLGYVLCVSSLRQLGAWSVLIGLANISHVAWQKRLRAARIWVLWLLNELLAVPVPDGLPSDRRIILIDATRLKEPGGCGDDWRAHLAYNLSAGRLHDVKISDQHTAEGLTLFEVQPQELWVGDRGYSRKSQVVFAMRAGADVAIRHAVSQFPLLDADGQPLDVIAWLKGCGDGMHSQIVAFDEQQHRFTGRLIAQSLPEEQAEKARKKERKKASKGQRQIQESTLFLCGWLIVFSSLPRQNWSDKQILALYRARWLIELFIKRLKQRLKLAQLRGKTAATNEAVIAVVMLAWALLHQELTFARQVLSSALHHWEWASRQAASTPEAQASALVPEAQAQGPTMGTLSSWTITALLAQTLRQLVQGQWTFARLQLCWPCLLRFLAHRRRRPHQESIIRSQLLQRLSLSQPCLIALFSCSSA